MLACPKMPNELIEVGDDFVNSALALGPMFNFHRDNSLGHIYSM